MEVLYTSKSQKPKAVVGKCCSWDDLDTQVIQEKELTTLIVGVDMLDDDADFTEIATLPLTQSEVNARFTKKGD